MHTVPGRRLAAIAALIVLALGICAVVVLNVVKGLSWSVSFTTVGGFVLAVALAATGPVRKLLSDARGTLPLSDTTLAKAREDLAQTLDPGLAEEERRFGINDPRPLPVRWSGPDAGHFDEIGEVFSRLRYRRLVILGPAGAGKTALAIRLVRDLLKTRRPGDPVPVRLPAATWTDSRTMTEWVADQLAVVQPGLAVQVRTGTGETIPLARTLAASEILPVIDGLDELPEGRRAQVITEINTHGSDSPVVLTCRPDEYTAATAARPVTLASVIRLVPLDLADVRSYLEKATNAPKERWRPVFDAFDADPGGPLAETLTNPLMLWLARTVYQHGTTEPGELADPGRFADRDAIEGHLLAGFVPAAYAARGQPHGFRCSPAQAQRWLGFLAARQSRAGAQDIAWWRLCRAEPAWSVLAVTLRTVLYTCLGWWAVTWALTRRGYWRAGAFTGHGHYRALLLAGPLGRAVRPLTDPLVKFSLTLGFGDHDVDSFLRSVAAFGLAGTAGVAIAAGLVIGLFWWPVALPPRTLRLTLARIRSAVLWRWLVIAVLAFLVWVLQTHREPVRVIASLWRTQLVLIWIGALTAGWVVSSLAVPVDVSSAGPDVLLRRAKRVYMLRCVAAVVPVATVWLWAGTTFATAAAGLTVARFVIAPILGSSADAWSRYREAALRLSVRRRLPWRTMSFLADAHQRGVLRQVGAAYQFGHIRLQAQLAAGYSPWPPRLAPWVASARAVTVTAWTKVRERLAGWQADPQSVTVDADTVSGVIAVRSPSDSVRRQLVSRWYLTAGAVAIAIIVGLISWYYSVAGLFLAAAALAASSQVRLRRHKAGSGVVPRSWSVRMIPGGIQVSQDGATVSLEMSDVGYVEIERVRTPDGSPTEWIALHAHLRSDVAVPFPMHRRRLPLVWLTTKQSEFTFQTTLPQLQAAIRWFPSAVVSRHLSYSVRAAATEYAASGARKQPALRWAYLLASSAVIPLLFIFSQWVLGIVCFLVIAGISLYRLDRHVATQVLPAGSWSLCVTPDWIDVEANGVVTHLTPDDIEVADLRTLRGRPGRATLFSAIELRLRAGVTAPYVTSDGWFPVYSKLLPGTVGVPTELVAALYLFAGHRFGDRLARLAKARRVGHG